MFADVKLFRDVDDGNAVGDERDEEDGHEHEQVQLTRHGQLWHHRERLSLKYLF